MRTRHYGFLADRCRKEKLAKILAYLDQPAEEPPADEEDGNLWVSFIVGYCWLFQDGAIL